MRRLVFTCLALTLACSRETPSPEAPSRPPATQPATSAPPSASATPQLQKGTYDEALLWLRSTPRFRFVVDEGGVHAEGEMNRTTPGMERVRFRANGEEWEAAASPQGVLWKRGGKPADPPVYGVRLYQRVTVAFDPQKKEGVPMLVSTDGPSNLYRFTNANTGEVHEVWVRRNDASLERIRIGKSVEMRFEP